MNRLLIAAAGTLIATSALAQSSTTTPPAGSTAPSATMSTTPSTNAGTGNAAHMNTTGQMFVTAQTSDQWLSSKFIGTDVIGPNDEKVGDVSDVLFDGKGQIHAYIVGVGGFLGMGQKDVAMTPDAFQAIRPTANDNEWKLKISMTKDQLKQAVAFKPLETPRATVGAAAPANPNRPAPVAPAPAPATNR